MSLREVLEGLPAEASVRIVINFQPVYDGVLSTFLTIYPALEQRWRAKRPDLKDDPDWMDRRVIDHWEGDDGGWKIYVSRHGY